MAGANPSLQKRLREQKMREKREDKARRKEAREEEKRLRAEAIARGENPDAVEGDGIAETDEAGLAEPVAVADAD